jgi:hypothetical protein
MSDFDEAFSDVVRAEAKRRPVWVIGLRNFPGEFYPVLAWAPCLGFIHGPPVNGKQPVFVPSASEGHQVWNRPLDEVYETEEAAEKGSEEKGKKQAEEFKSMLNSFRPLPKIDP